MVDLTAQLVALACHWNGRARGLHGDSFFPSNSTARFCEYVHFVRRQRRWFGQNEKWMIAAQTPDEWLALEAQPARRAIVARQPIDHPHISDRMSAGLVGGGGRWRLNLLSGGRMDVWELKWEVGDRKSPDQRIWRVSYALVAEDATAAPLKFESLDAIIEELRQALSDVVAFCEDHRLDSFAGSFLRAGECLAATDPLALVYHKDLSPRGYSVFRQNGFWLPAKPLGCSVAWDHGTTWGSRRKRRAGTKGSRMAYSGCSTGPFLLARTQVIDPSGGRLD
jgi:hypothetical protein